MKENSVIDKLKVIEVSIGKKMFAMTKKQALKEPPGPLQFKILNYLLKNKNTNVCQRDLEKNLKVSKATISSVLFTMEKKGIIIRSSSQTDARSKVIKLTDISLERFNEMCIISKKLNQKLIKNISKEELSQFLLILDKMKKNLDEI